MFDHNIAHNLLLLCRSLSSLSMQFASNDDVWLEIRKYISGPGVEPGTTAVVRCSTTELFRPIFTVHQVRTTTFLPPKSFFFFNLPSGSEEEFWINVIWTILNPIHWRMRCAKFGWNLPSDSWKDKKCEKFTKRRTYKWTTGDLTISLELSTQVS